MVEKMDEKLNSLNDVSSRSHVLVNVALHTLQNLGGVQYL